LQKKRAKEISMQKTNREDYFTTENLIVLTILFTSIIIMMISPESAQATVESSIKGVGSSLQKTSIGVAVAAFSLGGAGMMFGAQWGYRIAIGTVIGVCFVLGGPAIISYFQGQIR
jgi:type IV secretory pathway VirB2 component (pilin)